MKTFRLFAALLVVALLTAPAFSQDSGEIAALLAKARKGNGIAQYNLGLAYAEGKGVAADPLEAFVWLSLARENGARGRELDNFMGSVDKGILEQAQHRLTERKAELGVHSNSSVIVRTSSPASVPAAKPVTPAVTPPPAPPATAAPADPAALAAEVAALRAERERLINSSAEHEKSARTATEGNQALQEQARTAEAKAAELARNVDSMKGELARARLALTAAQKAAATAAKPAASTPPAYPDLTGRVAELENAYTAASTSLAQAQATLAAKPAAPSYPDLSGKVADLESQLASANAALKAKPASTDTAALAQKTRELQAALADLEEARTFGRKVEDTLNKVNDDKARVAAAAAAELAEARAFGAQVENTLNKVSDQKAALESSLRAAESARDSYASEFAAAKAQLAAVKPAAAAAPSSPAYPDLSGKVAELQGQVAKASSDLSAAAAAKSEALTQLAAAAAQATAAKLEAATLAKAKPAYPNLAGRVAELEKTNAALSSEAARAKQESAALAKAKDDANASLALAQAALAAKPAAPTYPDLRSHVSELETKLAATEKSLAAKPSAPAYPDLHSHVTELEAKIATLTTESTRAKQEMAGLTKAKEEAQAALAAKPVLPSFPDLRERVAQLESQLVAARASAPTYPDLSGKVTELAAALAAKPAAPAYPNLSGKVTELEAALAYATQKAAATELARTDIAKQFDDYKNATAAAQRERTSLLANVKLLESDKVSLRRQAESAGTESAQLRTQVVTLKEQLSAKPVTVAAAAPTYPDLSGKVAELEASLRDSTRQVAAASTEADRAHSEIAQLNKAIAEKPKAVEPAYPDLSTKVAELQAELTKQSADLSAAASAKAEALAQVAALTKAKQVHSEPITAGDSSRSDLSGRVRELEAQLAKAKTAPATPDLSGKVAELSQQLASAENASKIKSDYVIELEGKLRKQTAAVQEAGKAKGTIDSLTSEVAQLREDRERMQKVIADSGRKLRDSSADASRIKELETQTAGLQASLTTLSAEASQTKQQIAALTKAKEDAQTRTGELQAALAAKPAAPAYPDLSGKVAELEAALTAKPVSPNFPDLRERVTQLERDLATARASAPAYPDLSGKVVELESKVVALTKAKEKHSEPITAGGNYYPDLSGRVRELETQLAAASKNRAPAYPDLTGRVRELETQLNDASSEAARAKREAAALAKAKDEPRSPAYPDLRTRVAELETKLAQAAAQQATAPVAQTTDTSDLQKRLAETEDRLATSLRGYALLAKDRDALQAKSGQASEALTAKVAALTAQVEQLQSSTAAQATNTNTALAAAQAENTRLSESLAALQRSTGQVAGDAASNRALVQQLQGANSVLAQENYQLKTTLARATGASAPTVPASALVSPPAARVHVVASGDSLSKLSQRYYGTAGRWQEIYNANAGKLGPNGILRIGTELRIP